MIVIISLSQKEFLVDMALQGKNELIDEIERGSVVCGKWHVDVVNDLADEIRDSCAEMLQLIGFDEDYKLTRQGKQLEALIDIFYVLE